MAALRCPPCQLELVFVWEDAKADRGWWCPRCHSTYPVSPTLSSAPRTTRSGRDLGICRVSISGPCTNQATQRHHIVPKEHGGRNWASNLMAVCASHHIWIHRSRNRRQAIELGLLIIPG